MLYMGSLKDEGKDEDIGCRRKYQTIKLANEGYSESCKIV
jgi:hypothetical protein